MGLAGEGRTRGYLPCTELYCTQERWSCSPGATAPEAKQQGMLADWLAGQGLTPRSGEEKQEEHQEGTAFLSLWQPASNEEFLLPKSSFAKVQLEQLSKLS